MDKTNDGKKEDGEAEEKKEQTPMNNIEMFWMSVSFFGVNVLLLLLTVVGGYMPQK